jgi:hypothetical protein
MNEGIRIFEQEFDTEERDTQKLILKNALINFGIIAETLDQFVTVNDDVVELFRKFGSLLETAWEKF